MNKKQLSSFKTHKITIKKPFKFSYKEKIVCPYCQNTEDFYEVIENATFIVYYVQNDEGMLEPIEEDVEVLGPVRFFCGKCHADLTLLKNRITSGKE